MGFIAISCVAFRCFVHQHDASSGVSTHLLGSSIYDFGLARQYHYTFGWKSHSNCGAGTNFALQIQITTMHFNKRLG